MAALATPKRALSDARATRPAKPSASCLCAEHRDLATQLSVFDDVADEVDRVSRDVLLKDIYGVYDLLSRRMMPHMRAERAFRTRLAERDRRHVDADHDTGEMRDLVARLAGLKTSLARGDPDAPGAIRHVLYELHALTRLHFADELRICDERHPVGRSL